MQTVIGRFSEKNNLKEALESGRSELIVVYGRRRVGKTFLIRQTYADHIAFEIAGLHNGTMRDQLMHFRHRLAVKAGKIKRPNNWFEAFSLLEAYLQSLPAQKKKVVFIDEFPWLSTRKSKFKMAFESFWNHFVSARNDLVVVLCGSAANFMVKNVLRSKGGLHNRVTRRIRLMPFDLYETSLFLKARGIKYSQYDILQLYMAIGGIPQYLDNLLPGESVPQAIERLCFLKDAPLRTEFRDVFASLFEHPERHSIIMRTLGKSRKGLTRNQISEKSKIPTGGMLSQTLEELEESGFIEKYVAFGNIKKDALYRISDEYSLFYLKFIEPATHYEPGAWLKQANSHTYRAWAGFTFEGICIKHIQKIKTALGISQVASANYSWFDKGKLNKGAQIDLVIDRADNIVNLCEMKFHRGLYALTKGDADDLRTKIEAFQTRSKSAKTILILVFTTFGLQKNEYSVELVQNELKIGCLFKP